jgi:hypothetical protein
MPNLELIATKTVPTDGTSSITFSAIPQTYRDLKILVSARDDRAGQPVSDLSVRVGYNGTINTGSIYSYRRIWGNGSAAGSDSSSSTYMYIGMASASDSSANTFGNTELYFPRYTSAYKKSCITMGTSGNYGTTAWLVINTALANTSNAITDIQISANYGSGNYITGSNFYLYGVPDVTASATLRASGGVITSDDTYYYHCFTNTGVFTPLQNLTADYLIVAGGGGGGKDQGGGGGAGGYKYATGVSLTANTNYTAIVGAGGTAATATSGTATNSTFNSVSATKGGAGAPADGGANTGNRNGGSGGGAGGDGSGGGGTRGTGISGEGFDGGTAPGYVSGQWSSGGGGGAGAVGANGTTPGGGAGGIGINTYATFALVTGTGESGYYCGGGGGASQGGGVPGAAGGLGGVGRGGNGSGIVPNGTSGLPATGGGGGGSAIGAGNGGSGVVIVRYAK